MSLTIEREYAMKTTKRPGGEKRGNSTDRRRRKFWMLARWGDGETCPCVHCGDELTYATVEADRIIPGGPYRRENVQPACRDCNRDRSDNVAWVPPTARVA
jgi:hypothetical protein